MVFDDDDQTPYEFIRFLTVMVRERERERERERAIEAAISLLQILRSPGLPI